MRHLHRTSLVGLAIALGLTLSGCGSAADDDAVERQSGPVEATEAAQSEAVDAVTAAPPTSEHESSHLAVESPSGEVEQADESHPPTPAGAPREDMWTAEHYQQMLARMHGVDDPPVVEVVLEGHFEEIGPMVAECMQAAGFDATFDPNGGYTVRSETAQENAASYSMFMCEAQFLPLPVYYQPYDEATLARIYEHYQANLWPCFERNGHPLEFIPTFEQFRAQYETNRSLVFEASGADHLIERCDSNVPNDVLLGTE